jgi:hypothetical protein
MTGIVWPWILLASKLLERDERDAVLGDLQETNERAWRGFLDVFGLVLRRQAGLWKDSRPWLAGFAVALPCSYLLTTVSISVSCTYQRLVNHKVYGWHWPTGNEGFPLLMCHIFLLIAWSWCGGYIVGSTSRRTLWASAILSVIPALHWLNMYPPHTLPKLCMFLFFLPAIFGVGWGVRHIRITLRAASLLALTMTVLMICAWSNNALWILNWALILPAWYLVAAAWRSSQGGKHGRDPWAMS